MTFHESPIIGHSSLYALPQAEEAQARLIEVEVVRLDDAVPSNALLDVVKIDVEGAELDVIKGMSRILSDSPDNRGARPSSGPATCSAWASRPTNGSGAFARHGLKPRLIREPDGVVEAVDPEALMAVESSNLVFVRPGGAAEARLPR